MATNEEEHQDPAGSTGRFQRFVEENDPADAAEPRRSVMPYVLAGVGVIAVLAIIVVLLVVL
ncbi:hypothetical protein RIF23_20140 [Lipingzhangella sp. LS1_29]|uniref:Ssl1498 family light-harvesting-like protein n=1 Tax=Lipingzhangella rawalii TaxID=2055835 RepID=A0ABU2HBE1_9ACTN|nr:hypothetical protein [Lipingzhangella rawalii]MDS1272601.1 hypothetical protein [Lipingzhangella rawalii]